MTNKLYRSRLLCAVLAASMVLGTAGCSSQSNQNTADEAAEKTSDTQAEETSQENEDEETPDEPENDGSEKEEEDIGENVQAEAGDAPEIPGLEYESTVPLQYATGFSIYKYKDGYSLIDVTERASYQYFVVPEGKEVPEGIDKSIVVLEQPLDKIYLAATSAMSLFDSIDSLDHIRLSGTDASGWYVDNAVDAMNAGDILFAGKYSEPDYELLVDEDCDLAIESTMILHSPKVKEMIEDLGIPVLVDCSSYESHPLGRTEWIKLYGALVGKEEEAAAFFDEQAKVISDLKDFTNTEKTVAFFYINTDGTVIVRETTDYIPSMIEIAGGRYIFDSPIDPDSDRTSVSMSMEDFYKAAVDADYLIYNGTIDSPINSVEELLAKNELFADCKAVKEGNVWCAGKYLYQATDIVGNMIRDIHLMLTDGDASEMTFLTKID